jgi:hypothetical protein
MPCLTFRILFIFPDLGKDLLFRSLKVFGNFPFTTIPVILQESPCYLNLSSSCYFEYDVCGAVICILRYSNQVTCYNMDIGCGIWKLLII